MTDPTLAEVLAAWAQDPTDAGRARVLAALPGAALFVAVTATALAVDPSPVTGLPADSAAELAVVSVSGPGCGRALVVFTSHEQFAAWEPVGDGSLRPVAVSGRHALTAATQDGARGVLIDPGAAGFVVTPAELTELAAGRVPVVGAALSVHATLAALRDPTTPPPSALLASLGRALAGEPVESARLLEGPDGPVLGVVLRRAVPGTDVVAGLADLADLADLAALAGRVMGRVGADLPAGWDLAAVPADGPGQPVPIPSRARWRLPAGLRLVRRR